MDLNLPTIAFFTLRPIAKDEELTFDYMGKFGDVLSDSGGDSDSECDGKRNRYSKTDLYYRGKMVECKCAAKNCRKYFL